MAFLNIGKRLQPAKKAWKIFTRKLHSKMLLHRLNGSKAIKKRTKRLKPTTTAAPSWPSLAFKPRLKPKRQTIRSTHILRNYQHQKKRLPPSPPPTPQPVHIDQLFVEPPTSLAEHLQPPTTKEAKLPCWVADDVPGTSRKAVEGQDELSEADDMWESLGLASPLMDEIDKRAEEFITRIRGEMQLQEMMDRRS